MAKKMPDVALGERHGTREAIGTQSYREYLSGARATALTRCDCGTEAVVDVSAWRRGKANECSGCRANKMLASRSGMHGYANSSEYQSWLAMRRRCLDPKFEAYGKYGGAGIGVYGPWAASFQEFIADVGPKPTPQHTLDRLDNYEGYFPYNVRWATPKEQRNNQKPTGEAWEAWENATTGY